MCQCRTICVCTHGSRCEWMRVNVYTRSVCSNRNENRTRDGVEIPSRVGRGGDLGGMWVA